MAVSQKLELLSVVASNNASIFKVLLNGEEKIFIGKQNENHKFNDAPDIEEDKITESNKLCAQLKTLDSFQKGYSIDRNNIINDDKKKDVILPVVISKDIVQLGNYMFTMSEMTNNAILYLLYKNRLINRYVDDVNNVIFYEIDEEVRSLCGGEPSKILAYLKNNFTDVLPDGSYKAVENKRNYGNMAGAGLQISPEIASEKENEMPFNMLFEYDENYQYTNEESQIFVNYLQLKNHLSPFFNITVDAKNDFKLWRNFQKIVNNNNQLWMSYNLETPKELESIDNENVNGLFAQPTYIYDYNINTKSYNTTASGNYDKDSIRTFIGNNDYNEKFSKDFRNGFTIHLEADVEDFKRKVLYSYNKRAALQGEESCWLATTKDFYNAFINTSNHYGPKYDTEHNKIDYSNDPEIYFTVNFIPDDNSGNGTLEIECVKNYTYTTTPKIIAWENYDYAPKGSYLGSAKADNNKCYFQDFKAVNNHKWVNGNYKNIINIKNGERSFQETQIYDSQSKNKAYTNNFLERANKIKHETIDGKEVYSIDFENRNRLIWSGFGIGYSEAGYGPGNGWTGNGVGGFFNWSLYHYGICTGDSFNISIAEAGNEYNWMSTALNPKSKSNKMLKNVGGINTKLEDDGFELLSDNEYTTYFANPCKNIEIEIQDGNNTFSMDEIMLVFKRMFNITDSDILGVLEYPVEDVKNNDLTLQYDPLEVESCWLYTNGTYIKDGSNTYRTPNNGGITYSADGTISDREKALEKIIALLYALYINLGDGSNSYNIDEKTGLAYFIINNFTFSLWGYRNAGRSTPNNNAKENNWKYLRSIKHFNFITILSAFHYVTHRYRYYNKGDKIVFKDLRIVPWFCTNDSVQMGSKNYDVKNCKKWKKTLEYINRTFAIHKSKYTYNNIIITRPIYNPMENYSSPDTYNDEKYNPARFSVIDIFGSTIRGTWTSNFIAGEADIINAIKKLVGRSCCIDLTVSFFDDIGMPKLIIKTYINSKLIVTQTYDKDSNEYKWLWEDMVNGIKNEETEEITPTVSCDNLKFYTYGFSYNIPNTSYKMPKDFCFLKYYNISMWNYPLELSQIKQLFSTSQKYTSTTSLCNNTFTYDEFNEFTEVPEDDAIVGKIFSVDKYTSNIIYPFKNSSDLVNKRLYKIQDFDYIDKIKGFHKLQITEGRKSNLYSVKIKNTGLGENPYDDPDSQEYKDYEDFRLECLNTLESAVNTVCSKVEPIGVKLFSMIVEN